MVSRADDRNIKELIAERIIEARQVLAESIASRIGPPPRSDPASSRQQLDIWLRRSPKFQDPGLDILGVMELLQAGQTEDQILDAMFPSRRELIEFGRPTDAERIRYSKRMARLAEQHPELSTLPDEAALPGADDAEVPQAPAY